MSRNNKDTHFPAKCISKLPLRILQIKYGEKKTCPCFCSKLFENMTNPNSVQSLEAIGAKSEVQVKKDKSKTSSSRKNKSTQVDVKLKNIYDEFILEGLLNTNNNKYIKVKALDNITDEKESLRDIKKILLTTNDKLDLILSTLTCKKEQLIHKYRDQGSKYKKHLSNKYGRKSEKIKSYSHFHLHTKKSNVATDMTNSLHPKSNYISNFYTPKLEMKKCFSSNPFFISPYNTSYYIKPMSTINYFKGIGEKYPKIEMVNTVWDPFSFMTNNLHSNGFKGEETGVNKMKHDSCTDNNDHEIKSEELHTKSISYNN